MDPHDQIVDLENRVHELEIQHDSHSSWSNIVLFVMNFLLAAYLLKVVVFTAPVFKKIFREMLGDEPLPLLTQCVTGGQMPLAGLLLGVMIGLTCFNVATRFRHRYCKTLNASLLAVHLAVLLLLWQAFLAPFAVLIEQLGA
jgi:hypothetical protein